MMDNNMQPTSNINPNMKPMGKKDDPAGMPVGFGMDGFGPDGFGGQHIFHHHIHHHMHHFYHHRPY